LCGVIVAHDVVHLQPCLPPHWPQARVALRLGARRITVLLCRAQPLFERMLAENPGARVVASGESVPLAGLGDSELWLVLCGSVPPVDAERGAVQQANPALQEAALTPPLAGG
jgi:cyclic beta-1,2-glucan synthetase